MDDYEDFVEALGLHDAEVHYLSYGDADDGVKTAGAITGKAASKAAISSGWTTRPA